MRAILDTHTLIWAQDNPAKLGGAATQMLLNPAILLLISAATIWEIGIKIEIGRASCRERVW